MRRGPVARLIGRLVGAIGWRRFWRRLRDHRSACAKLSRLLEEGERLKRRAANEANPPLREGADWIEQVAAVLEKEVDKAASLRFRQRAPRRYCAVHSDAGVRASTANEAFWNGLNAYTSELNGLIAELS